ncbi:uncharacterized protein LOC135649679 isoform X2 [Musa acuminata AAA Group]|uniref:uncharacterized protein LOC135649679 isoform X2 n=1 Tax=Musa acuminata AAA Group TaxID=214697 RepID=UPI0031D41766
MGNALGGRKKAAKIMKIDGTTFKVKPPAQAITVLRDHPGHVLLESDEVKRLSLRARPLDPDAQLQRGKLYFLVELTQLRGRGAPRRAWSGQLQVGAKERLESLRLTRRSMSDLSLAGRCSVDVEEAKDGAVRLRVRLPKVQVEKLMQDSRDAAEAANKIMQLCVEKDGVQQKLLQPTADRRKEPSEKQGEEEDMGNALGGRKKAAKIMKIDGTTFKVKPPAQAITVLRDHPGHALLESDEVKRLSLRARPLDPDAQLQRGKLYFLVELTQLRGRGAPRRAWSGQLQVGAKERLESLRLTRRSMSDLSLAGRCSVDVEEAKDGAVRLRVRLPKVQVEKLMQDSRDAAEAANKIMQLCVEKDGVQQKLLQPTADRRKEKRTRFVVTPDEIIV